MQRRLLEDGPARSVAGAVSRAAAGAVALGAVLALVLGWRLVGRERAPVGDEAGRARTAPIALAPTVVRDTTAAAPGASDPSDPSDTGGAPGRADGGGAPATDAQAPSPDDWVELNNRATVLLGEGELERAVELFERCARSVPENDVFARNLAEALIRLALRAHEARDLESACASLERALALSQEREDVDTLRTLLARWNGERSVEANHWTEDSDLFELSYDTGRADILHRSQEVLDHLEREYEALRLWFGRDPVREHGRARLRVVLYRQAEFARLTGLGDWAGGAFDGVVRVAVEDLATETRRWQRTLTHELVHAFVHALGGNTVPGWLNEGLAQFLEDEAHVRAAGAGERLTPARERLGEARFPLDALQGSLATWDDADEIGRAYAQSLLLVDRIARSYGEEALRRMVFGCRTGVTPAASFEAWAAVPLAFVVERL